MKDKMDIFQIYYENFVHPEYAPIGEAHAMVEWKVDGTPMNTLRKRNLAGKHVEHVVLDEMFPIIREKKEARGVDADEMRVDVKLYMNFSPCNFTKYIPIDCTEAYTADIDWPEEGLTCCEALIAFKNRDDIDVRLDVVFVTLYKIGRQSCFMECPGRHYTAPGYQNESDRNKEGLRNLNEADIGLRTFSPQDWDFLRLHLLEEADYAELLSFEQIAARLKEDERMKRDLEAILGPVGDLVAAMAGANLGPGNQA